MEFSKFRIFLFIALAIEILVAGFSFVLIYSNYFNYKVMAISGNVAVVKNTAPVYVPPQKLNNPPQIIKAVYVTGYSAGTKKYLDYLSNFFKNTEINAVVVDIKGSDGYVTYASGAEDVKKYKLSDNAIPDIDSLINFFHNQNIYVIGRIANFEDPVYSKAKPELAIYNKIATTDLASRILWRDNNGLSWLDPASKNVWGYNVSLAKDAFYHGFDEINFDYVRFPSDGKTSDMGFPAWDGKTAKSEIIKNYFQYLRANLPNEKISVDLFGQTTTNTDDMGIGQIIENAFENFDYISPMVYPSHYINGFLGFANPADHPYDLIKYEMDSALARENAFKTQQKVTVLAKFRPWLQSFNMKAVYDADMIKQEIKATQDALGGNFSGYMLWNPLNKYIQDSVLKAE